MTAWLERTGRWAFPLIAVLTLVVGWVGISWICRAGFGEHASLGFSTYLTLSDVTLQRRAEDAIRSSHKLIEDMARMSGIPVIRTAKC